MTKRILLFLLCFFIVSVGSYGQTWRQFKKEAKKAFVNQEYDHALYYLDTMQKIDSAKFDLYFLQAEAAQYYNAFELSEKSYLKVLADEKSDNLLPATFGLALVQKMQGKYPEAIKGFNEYLIMNPDSSSTNHREAKFQIQACLWAMELIKFNDKDLKIRQLGTEVNTEFSDFAPVVHNNKLLFSALKFKSEDKKNKATKKYSKVLELKEGAKEATPFDLGLADEKKHTAHIAFDKAGNRLFFNICNYSNGSKIQCKIYTRVKLGDNTWSEAIALPEIINAVDKTTTQPNIGYDKNLGKEILFFASDRMGGKGGLDLWMSYFDEKGQPTSPINLKQLNTDKDEISPFFHNYTQTLYFSSNGQKSLGGHDVYKTTLQNEVWQEIIHTGFPLNSSYNDVYFSLNHIGSEGYFASNREGTRFLDKQISACCYDVFKAEFNSYLLDLNVLTYLKTDEGTIDLNDVTVSVYELFEDAEQSIAHKLEPEGNSHFFRIKSNKKYRIVAEKKDYFPANLEFDTETPLSEGDVVIKKIFLQPLKLNILTFTDEPPMAPLEDVNITVVEIDKDGNLKQLKPLYDPVKNSIFFPLLSDRKYQIVAFKDGYDQVIEEFTTTEWKSTTNVLRKELILPREEAKIKLNKLKPFSLYFDNNAPNGGNSTTTSLTYTETLEDYQSRKEEFKKEYAEGLTGKERTDAIADMEQFFEKDMIGTYEKFIKFTESTLERLDLGRNITIRVQGYASPLASANYNLILTKRRIQSMYNFYNAFKGGAMKKYVDSGRLIIELIPHGEEKAPKGISDNPNDRRNSVFGLDASKQRRVEIKEAESIKNKEKPTPVKGSSELPE